MKKEFVQGWNYFKFGVLLLEMTVWRIAGIPMALFALIAAIKLRKKMVLNTGLLALWIFSTSLPFFLLKIMTERYYLLFVPAVAVLSGRGFAYLIEEKKHVLLGATAISVILLICISANYSKVIYKTDFNWKYTNETVQELDAWISTNVPEDSTFIILSDPYIMRTIRLTAENSLKNPKEQMVVNPSKREFETIVENPGEHYLILENATPEGKTLVPISETWLYALEKDWQEYLKSKGFEKVREFHPKNSYFVETYLVYKKVKRR